MRLGNDIVDLRVDSEIHPRFASRILHPVEKTLYPVLDDRLVWKLWAAKEAAFKAHRQGANCVGFLIPSRWLVDLSLGRVFFGDEEYLLSFDATEDYILATARSEDFAYEAKVFSGEAELTPTEQKAESKNLHASLGISSVPIKDQEGIPRYILNNRPIPYSLTHHGRHIAVAVHK